MRKISGAPRKSHFSQATLRKRQDALFQPIDARPRMAWRNLAHSDAQDFGSAAKITFFASDVEKVAGCPFSTFKMTQSKNVNAHMSTDPRSELTRLAQRLHGAEASVVDATRLSSGA